jgi:hypothetical protein
VDCEARVLQQRIQVRTVGRRRREALERIRRQQRKQQEARRQQSEHADHPRREYLRQVVAEITHRDRPDREDQDPHQQRALVCAPHGRHLVHRWQRELRMVGNVQHRKVALHECPYETAEGEGHEEQVTVGGSAPHGHHRRIVTMRADERDDALAHRQRQCQDQRKMPNLRNHRVRTPWTCAVLTRSGPGRVWRSNPRPPGPCIPRRAWP